MILEVEVNAREMLLFLTYIILSIQAQHELKTRIKNIFASNLKMQSLVHSCKPVWHKYLTVIF